MRAWRGCCLERKSGQDSRANACVHLMCHMDKLGDIDSPSTKAYVD